MPIARTSAALLSVLVTACGPDQEERVFQEARSPDGAWIAQGIDEHHFGPGNAAEFIRVSLNRAGADKKGAQDVLSLNPNPEDNYPGNPHKHLNLHWQSPSRLILTYHDADAVFVVRRIWGVDVLSQPG